MAYDYNKAKQAWESMNDQQKRQYTEQNKNDSNFQQFAQQYHNENYSGNQWSTQPQINTNTVWDQQKMNWYISEWDVQRPQQNAEVKTVTPEEQAESVRKAQEQLAKQNQASENFDSSRLTNPNAQVSVKEGTAAQTWTPDYDEDSEARMNEITNNLNAYWNTNKSYFTDRATFNSTFHYDDRSDKQKALLDSFWKGTQDQTKANSYTNGNDVMAWFNEWEITPSIMNNIREANPEAYNDWQKQMEERVNTLIANQAAPRDVWDTAELWEKLVQKFWLEAWDPYQIYDEWYKMSEQLWVFRDSQQLASMSNNIASIYSTMNNNVQSLTSQLEGRYSSWYIAARIDKANSKLNTQAQNMQYSYNLLLQNRNQNMAIAQQAAAMKQAQGQEDSRVFNNKLNALWFAMKADSYRTPEQQAQLQLQTQQALNEMNLLNQSKLSDLQYYNQRQNNWLEIQHMYDLQEAQDAINFERTDLTVENEWQLRVNLSNVLQEYYDKYWDIIQRSKSQVIEDILATARNEWISVIEALKKDFLTPLQNKQEYKNMIAAKYAAPATQSVKMNSDWTISYWATTYWGVTYKPVTSWAMESWLADYNNKTWQTWGWCGKFVNDYLQDIWVWRLYWDSIASKTNTINTDKNDLANLSVWSIAVFDYTGANWVSADWQKYGHVAIVDEIDESRWMVRLLESNYAWDKKVTNSRWVAVNSKYLKWFFDPSKWSNQWASNLSAVDEAKKENYIEALRRWSLTNTQVWELADLAAKQWWSDEYREALNQWLKINLTDAQIKRKDVADNRFFNNDIVKDFETASLQINNLIDSLEANNWAWDLAAIFQFMKVLDPRSVVRWEEFENAAWAAWYAEPEALYQKYVKHWWDGTWLTDAAKWNFSQLAKALIKSQAEMYNLKYNALLKEYDNAWLDPSIAPDNFAQQILDRLESRSTPTITYKTNVNWYDKYTDPSYNNWVWSVVNVWGYEYSSNFYDN